MLLSEWVDQFETQERPSSLMLDGDNLLALAIAAANFYAGYAVLAVNLTEEAVEPYPEITVNTDLTVSEWAIIKPLFLLYVERETATQLEASRGMGVDVFGRSTSEINGDITNIEQNIMPKLAFSQPIITV